MRRIKTEWLPINWWSRLHVQLTDTPFEKPLIITSKSDPDVSGLLIWSFMLLTMSGMETRVWKPQLEAGIQHNFYIHVKGYRWETGRRPCYQTFDWQHDLTDHLGSKRQQSSDWLTCKATNNSFHSLPCLAGGYMSLRKQSGMQPYEINMKLDE